MSKIAAVVVAGAAVLTACDDPGWPRHSFGPTASLESGPVAEIAFDDCSQDWWSDDDGGLVCVITVRYTDGSSTDVANGTAPAWSPVGARLAFTDPSESEVVAVNIGDGSLTNLTEHPARDWSPAWSPDGSKIAFQSDRDGPAELYVMDADGSNVVRLTRNVGFAGDPAPPWFTRAAVHPDWSPDGARIAFDCEVQGGNRDVCVINADGTGLVRLTTDPAEDSYAAWSPDGTRMAFASKRWDPWYAEIAVMNADGSGLTRLTYNVGSASAGHPDWSPSGAKIAFSMEFWGACQDYYCDGNVYVMNADGTDVEWLATGANPAWRPAKPGQ